MTQQRLVAVARMTDARGDTCEVTRIATDGTPNACSKLWSLVRRIAQTMGYARLTTMTLPFEGGASLRGAGLTEKVAGGGGSWDRDSRPREDKACTDEKWRWTETLTQ